MHPHRGKGRHFGCALRYAALDKATFGVARCECIFGVPKGERGTLSFVGRRSERLQSKDLVMTASFQTLIAKGTIGPAQRLILNTFSLRLPRVWFFVVLISALIISNSSGMCGNAFQDVWGIFIDPLKLGKLSDSAERSLIQLRALEGQGNYDVQQRLEQIRSIVQDAIGGTQQVIDDATARMLALEGIINVDAIKLIYRAQCATEVVLRDQLQRAFAQLIANLKKADPSVKILGIIPIGEVTVNEIKIEDPDKAFYSTKDAVLESLKKEVNENSKAWLILSAYENLEASAKFTRCYYMDQGSDRDWVSEVNEVERLSLPWVLVVKPQM
jgi:hypothetical protein